MNFQVDKDGMMRREINLAIKVTKEELEKLFQQALAANVPGANKYEKVKNMLEAELKKKVST